MSVEITDELVEYMCEHMDVRLYESFKYYKKHFGKLDPVVGGSIPHAVHWREGMEVRNIMRASKLCVGWDDHDYDDNWVEVIKRVLKAKKTDGGGA